MWKVSVLLISVIPSLLAGTCPSGSTEATSPTGYIYGAPQPFNDMYGFCNSPNSLVCHYSIPDVETCRLACFHTPACVAFSWLDNTDSWYYPSKCQLYNSDTPQTWNFKNGIFPDLSQVFCILEETATTEAPLACPDGTEQMGNIGAKNVAATLYGVVVPNIDLCYQACSSNPGCKSFSFDPDITTSQYQCWLYHADVQDYVDHFPHEDGADSILCDVNADTGYNGYNPNPAHSNGLSNIDSVAITNGNGDSMEISVYIIYGVIGLVLVNIICLIVNCWRKCNGNQNGKRYKVVKMRSDDDSSDV